MTKIVSNDWKEKIKQAFVDVKMPTAEKLIATYYANRDQDSILKTKELFAGKTWQELDKKFLKENWAHFCYFTAEAFQYYLPALLTQAVEPFSDENDFLHSVIYELRPSPYQVFTHEGKDPFFAYQISLLTKEQYAVVTEFLQHIIEGNFSAFHRYRAAQAVRFGWNQHQTNALQASQNLYQHFYHYTYPPYRDVSYKNEEEEEQTLEKEKLITHIRQAFANTPLPKGPKLTASIQGDKPFEIDLAFLGTDWKTVHPEFLACENSALSFFDAAAFRYYLPAYLMAFLYGEDGNTDPVFQLTYGFCKEYEKERAYGEEKMALFSQEERAAICAFLEYCRISEFDRENIDQALESYWRPSQSL